MYFVYILECADKTFYVGSTNDLERRLHAHNHLKSGAHYTKIRRPVKLVYSEQFKTYGKARAREGELKRLKRSEKEAILKPMAKRASVNTKNKTTRSKKTKKRLALSSAKRQKARAGKRK